MEDEREQRDEDAIEGTLGRWRFRATDTPGEILFSSEGEEQVLWVTGGNVVEARDADNGQELYVRTERYEHTVRRDAREQKWRVVFTKRDATEPPAAVDPQAEPGGEDSPAAAERSAGVEDDAAADAGEASESDPPSDDPAG